MNPLNNNTSVSDNIKEDIDLLNDFVYTNVDNIDSYYLLVRSKEGYILRLWGTDSADKLLVPLEIMLFELKSRINKQLEEAIEKSNEITKAVVKSTIKRKIPVEDLDLEEEIDLLNIEKEKLEELMDEEQKETLEAENDEDYKEYYEQHTKKKPKKPLVH